MQEHATACERCRAKLQGFDDEQRRFEDAIPFERFAAGVERAARTPAPARRRERPVRWVMALAASLVALAAGVGATVRAARDRFNNG